MSKIKPVIFYTQEDAIYHYSMIAPKVKMHLDHVLGTRVCVKPSPLNLGSNWQFCVYGFACHAIAVLCASATPLQSWLHNPTSHQPRNITRLCVLLAFYTAQGMFIYVVATRQFECAHKDC